MRLTKLDFPHGLHRDQNGTLCDRTVAIFDGACGFCTWSVARLRQLPTLDKVMFIPYQRLTAQDYRDIGIELRDCLTAMYVWESEARTVTFGAEAFNRLLRATPYTLVSEKLWQFGPTRCLEVAVYQIIARNRMILSRVLRTRSFALFDAHGEADA